METITIPSPTVFLSSPVLKPAPEPPPAAPPPPKRKPTAAKTSSIKVVKKPNAKKQSKSRNGCITCKAKRLKCDETKPSCQQCHRRSATCGGYKKDFKWRPFEETTVFTKATNKPKRNSVGFILPDPVLTTSPNSNSDASPTLKSQDDLEHDVSMQDSFFGSAAPTPPPAFTPPSTFPNIQFDQAPMFDMSTPTYTHELPRPRFEADSVTRSLSSLFEDPSLPVSSGQSPRLINPLLPGSELNARPATVSALEMPMESMELAPIDHFIPSLPEPLEDDIEEIQREPQTLEPNIWLSPFARATSPTTHQIDPFFKLYWQPEVQAGSPEMLMLRFDKQTCGILSVKDGPTENPWRTLIWPLARDSPALYHAIAAMTAFHTSKEKPALRVEGIEHIRRSQQILANGINGSIRTEAAIATTLALAFSESWDTHTSTGFGHLRGARALINRAVTAHQRRNLVGDDLARLRFLANTWVYMDVIARLTSFDEDESDDFDQVQSLFNSGPNNVEIDPLMGCASSLFPLVGRVANLCRRVRKLEASTIATISQAIELKEAIVQWSPPSISTIDHPEDPTSEVQHALQTAEAYRYATLLYLHQAIPEIPSWTSAQLASKVLVYLATVPLSSRFVIVQIYPLLAAGCEAVGEDRQWVEERWQSMTRRMWIGNLDRCWEVTREVWFRRDAFETVRETRKETSRAAIIHSESLKRKFQEEMALESFEDMLNPKRQRLSFSETPERKRIHEPVEEYMERDLTVRGRLHWVGVMRDWNWEGK